MAHQTRQHSPPRGRQRHQHLGIGPAQTPQGRGLREKIAHRGDGQAAPEVREAALLLHAKAVKVAK